MGLAQSWHIHLVGGIFCSRGGSAGSFHSNSVHCASVHRKIGTHVTKVYVPEGIPSHSILNLLRLKEELDVGFMDKGTSRGMASTISLLRQSSTCCV